MPYQTLFEDSWVVAVKKAAGFAVQTRNPAQSSLFDELLTTYGADIRVIHRIDQPASGIVLFARSKAAASRFSSLFSRGEVERRYWAIVSQRPPADSGLLEHRILHRQRRNKSEIVDNGGKLATLTYQLAGTSDRYWLLDVEIHTGRHHQIRAQLAAISCPIRGDLKYGAKRSNRGGGIDLHAHRLAFTHPFTGEAVTITAPPPSDPLWAAIVPPQSQS